MAIVDWDYYNLRFPQVSQTDFIRLNEIAQWEILNFIPPYRIEELEGESDFRYIKLKDAICNLINFLDKNEKSPAGKGITSVSNDGYSENYSLTSKSDMNIETMKLCIRWLSGTGLMGAL